MSKEQTEKSILATPEVFEALKRQEEVVEQALTEYWEAHAFYPACMVRWYYGRPVTLKYNAD